MERVHCPQTSHEKYPILPPDALAATSEMIATCYPSSSSSISHVRLNALHVSNHCNYLPENETLFAKRTVSSDDGYRNSPFSKDASAATSDGFSTCSPSSSSSPLDVWSEPRHVPKRKAGRKKFKETRHPVFRGVRHRNGGKWVCEIREPQKKSRIWLGTYTCPEMAARAHDVAVIALRGKGATLNFADSAWRLPAARTTSPEDIREAAQTAIEHLTVAVAAATPGTQSRKPARPSRELTSSVEPLFIDVEALFDMPGLITDLAEGLLITPPSFKVVSSWDDVDCHVDLDLWNQ
ncbi:dehydration-responsive element-binding protein 1F [Amborella trichopoda]|nr:dehydration-responsive element-binding protein 1F [Amborella trichopoda]|eukprot:XP_006832878.2 dehydration-responsive element-binding protein 1F [Amborella trichopoda]